MLHPAAVGDALYATPRGRVRRCLVQNRDAILVRLGSTSLRDHHAPAGMGLRARPPVRQSRARDAGAAGGACTAPRRRLRLPCGRGRPGHPGRLPDASPDRPYSESNTHPNGAGAGRGQHSRSRGVSWLKRRGESPEVRARLRRPPGLPVTFRISLGIRPSFVCPATD